MPNVPVSVGRVVKDDGELYATGQRPPRAIQASTSSAVRGMAADRLTGPYAPMVSSSSPVEQPKDRIDRSRSLGKYRRSTVCSVQ
jgi:hypothetical protein